MLRGAIESVASTHVLGWVYSEAGHTTGSTVLAFLDEVCIGSGNVELLREDLLDAGLGDGKLGFAIPVAEVAPEDTRRVTVRLEGSDFQLIQNGVRVARDEEQTQSCPFLHSEKRLEWMRGQGWLSQQEIDIAKQMIRIGIYDYSLRNPKQAGEVVTPDFAEPALAAQNLLSLLHLEPVQALETNVIGIEALRDAESLKGLRHPVAAIWSKKRESVFVIEGSHAVPRSAEEDSMAGAIEYTSGPDRLLLVDMRCTMSSKSGLTQPKYTIYTVPA